MPLVQSEQFSELVLEYERWAFHIYTYISAKEEDGAKWTETNFEIAAQTQSGFKI